MFETSVEDLFLIYLNAIPEDYRQYHNCHCCRRFINKFGGLVTIDETGETRSAFWSADDAPDELENAIAAVIKAVERSRVTSVFICSEEIYGTPVTEKWHHLSLSAPKSIVFKNAIQSAFQASAEKSEDFKNVSSALADFPQAAIEQAVKLLKTEALYRSEKILGQAEWLLNLKITTENLKGQQKQNIVWRAISTAPAGFCHPRSSVIGSLLFDIASGVAAEYGFDEVARRFAAKMHPLQYQRPTAAPKEGTIAEAEKIMAKLKAEGSLQRRFCRLDEVKSLWRPSEPRVEKEASGGVFGHLKSKQSGSDVADIQTPASKMTWQKFRSTVLSNCQQIELYIPSSRGNYGCLVTAVNPDSPPILQWDTPDDRNPVSWYLWGGGSSPSQFGLNIGGFHKVSAICLGPSQWRDESDCQHQGERLLLLLDGAKESRNAGIALFPEILRTEFHGIRAVIEAHSKTAKIEGMEDPHACGLILAKGDQEWSARIRATTNGLKSEYCLDRWD